MLFVATVCVQHKPFSAYGYCECPASRCSTWSSKGGFGTLCNCHNAWGNDVRNNSTGDTLYEWVLCNFNYPIQKYGSIAYFGNIKIDKSRLGAKRRLAIFTKVSAFKTIPDSFVD